MASARGSNRFCVGTGFCVDSGATWILVLSGGHRPWWPLGVSSSCEGRRGGGLHTEPAAVYPRASASTTARVRAASSAPDHTPPLLTDEPTLNASAPRKRALFSGE